MTDTRKVVAIIQARMGSTRLPGKVLLEVNGKHLLEHMIDRVRQAKRIDEIVIATTILPEDDAIVRRATELQCAVHRGSVDDVLSRYYHAAKESTADVVVRLTSDCPLIDPEVIDSIVSLYLGSEYDFVSNSEPLPSTWPDGMDVSVFDFASLEDVYQKAKKPSDREHVTFYFWQNTRDYKSFRVDLEKDQHDYRLTIDYPEDFQLIREVILHFSQLNNSARWPNTRVADLLLFLDQSPHLRELNIGYVRGLGWKSSFDKDKLLGY